MAMSVKSSSERSTVAYFPVRKLDNYFDAKTLLKMVIRKALEVTVEPRLFPLVLFKRILRLHYGLPPQVRFLGDQYVRAEFRAHKDVTDQKFLHGFFNEWINYSNLLSKQLSNKGIVKGVLGKDLDGFDNFQEEQLRQLYDLKMETEALKAGKQL